MIVLSILIILGHISSTSTQVKLSRGKSVVIDIDAFVIALSSLITLGYSFSWLSVVVTIDVCVIVLNDLTTISHSCLELLVVTGTSLFVITSSS